MEISYKTVDLEEKSIVLQNAIEISINGIKIDESEEGIIVHVERAIVVKPRSANRVEIVKDVR